MRNAVIKDATGEVLRFGALDFTPTLQAGESQVALNEDSALPIKDMRQVKVVGGEFTLMSDAERLPVAKQDKSAEIDRRTSELIAAGFSYAGETFSLSTSAQARLMGINQVRDDPNVTYPIRWNNIDDSAVHEIQDADEVLAFYLTAVGTYRAHVDSGTALKDSVRATTTIAEVDAVVDNR